MIRAKEYMGFYWQDRQQCLDEYLSFIIDLLIGIEAAVERRAHLKYSQRD